MGFFNKLKNLFNKILRRKDNNEILELLGQEKTVKQLPTSNEYDLSETYEPIELPEGELVSFSDEVLDTTSKVSIEKLKHNLEILIKKAKETGKIDKFMLIREDNLFPTDWEWTLLSKNTNLEKECTPLSYELKKAYALEQSGISPYTEIMGMTVPNASYDDTMKALSKVDKTFGSVLLPSKFRSTKHFTINTPLGVTGDYNSVQDNRDYIIIDNMNAFLSSKYAYSVSYHDAYLDISHESLPISEEAIVLINEKNYERIMSDEKVAKELSKRKVVRFKVDEKDEDKAKDGEIIAINMILTEMGALPSTIGTSYAHYDKEIRDIIDNSIKNLAKENGLFFDKSHGGELKPDKGHFSNYYDEKNKDYENSLKKFIAFLRQKFPEHEELFPEYLILTENTSIEIVKKLGTTNLSKAIDEYNELSSNRVKEKLEEYKLDRKNITPEVHQQFVETIALINDFYKSETNYESYEIQKQIEEAIQRFIQGETVSEQLEAAKSVWELFPSKNLDRSEATAEAGTINIRKIVENAINKGTSVEHIIQCDNAEAFEKPQKLQMEGETRSDR